MKILIVEDEPGLQLGLGDLFEEHGYAVCVCGEGAAALQEIENFAPDGVVLDLGLPDMDGARILDKLHRERPELPIIVLTARAGESEIVAGFGRGAHDYVTKPFSPKVLLARVESLLRRRDNGSQLKLGDLEVDFNRYAASRDGAPVHLTTREIELLKFLYRFRGQPVSRHDILDEVWGMDSETGPRTVDTHVALLRKKVEPNPEKPRYLKSQRGIGYKLVVD